MASTNFAKLSAMWSSKESSDENLYQEEVSNRGEVENHIFTSLLHKF